MGFAAVGQEADGPDQFKRRYLLSVELGQVAQSHCERLRVILLDPKVDRLQTAHVEKQLGLLQSHGAARDTSTHCKGRWGKMLVLRICHLFSHF